MDFIKRDNIHFSKLTRYRGSHQALVQARTLTRCSRKSNIFIFLSGGVSFYVCTSVFRISYRFRRYDCLRPALPGAKGIVCKLWSGRRLWLDLLQVTAGWLRALRFHLFCYGSCRFSLQAQCGPAPLPGDDLSRCWHLPAGSGSRDLLDCLLCRDGSAGQSF